MTRQTLNIAVVAGETSGDVIGAGLIRELARLCPGASFEGIAGPRMMAEGARSLYPMDAISIMGLDGLADNLRNILAIRRGLVQRFTQTRPDVFVGVDVPDFNLGLATKLRRAGIPTVHYVSPTVWAWRRYRIRKIRRAVDHMMTLFPFEERFYREHNVPVSFVGHPLADRVEPIARPQARQRLSLAETGAVVAVLPGSRRSEIDRLAAPFAVAARMLRERHPGLRFVVPAASATLAQRLGEIFAGELPEEAFVVIDGQAQLALQAADVALLASGTAALEAALLCTPMVVAYRVSALSYLMVQVFSTVEHFSMPNHLLDSPDVPEFIQDNVTPEKLADAVGGYLDDAHRRDAMRARLAGIRERLAVGADERAARIVAGFARGSQ